MSAFLSFPSQPAAWDSVDVNHILMHPGHAALFGNILSQSSLSLQSIPPYKIAAGALQQGAYTKSASTGKDLQLMQKLLTDLITAFSSNKCHKALEQLIDSFCAWVRDVQAALRTAINAAPNKQVQQCPNSIDGIASAVTQIECTLLAVNKKQQTTPFSSHTYISYAATAAAVVAVAAASQRVQTEHTQKEKMIKICIPRDKDEITKGKRPKELHKLI